MANSASLDGPFPVSSLRFTLGCLLDSIHLSYARALMETGSFTSPIEAPSSIEATERPKLRLSVIGCFEFLYNHTLYYPILNI
ncbi:hypothetical protein N7523_009160 [Penicillium sp. IBT 18751x]|nr:hypothetical protein N7523_009160 [Penicillium sp. IBT 18751x]